MSPVFPVAQISPGVGVLEGLLIIFFVISLFFVLLVSAIGCGVQMWRLSRRGVQTRRRWLAATIVSSALLLGFTGSIVWIVIPKPLPQFEKRWDFTRSHGLDVIGEHGDQDHFTYTGKITADILLPGQRSLSVQAQNLFVKCEQGQIKEIEVLIPGLKPEDDVRKQGETILHYLKCAPATIDQWRTGYPGFGWTIVHDNNTDLKITLDGHSDLDRHSGDRLVDTTLTILIEWEN